MMSRILKKIIFITLSIVFIYSSAAYCAKNNNLIDIYNKFSAENRILLSECMNKLDVTWFEYLEGEISKFDTYNRFMNSFFDENDNYIINRKTRVKDTSFYKKPSRAGALLNIIYAMIKQRYDMEALSKTAEGEGRIQYRVEEYGIEVFKNALTKLDDTFISTYLQGVSKALDKINDAKSYYDFNVYSYGAPIKTYRDDYLGCFKLSDWDLEDGKYCIRLDCSIDEVIAKQLLGDDPTNFKEYMNVDDEYANIDFILGMYTRNKLDLEDVKASEVCGPNDINEFLKYVQNEDYLKG